MKNLILAIDMGGTTAKIAIATNKGEIVHKFIVDTKWGDEALPFFNQEIRKKIKSLNIDYDKDIDVVGFGCVGPIDAEKGISINAQKIGWTNYPIREIATKLFKKPIFIINDARSIAYGEWKKGAGKQYHSFLIFSIGTGIGGGLVLNNKIFTGAHNTSGEFEHGGYNTNVKYKCGCGLRYCIGGLSTAIGIERYFQNYIIAHPGSSLAILQKQLGREIKIKDISTLIKKWDPDATEALSFALQPLIGKISTLIYAIDPQAILIGGGPSALGQNLIDIIMLGLKRVVWKDILEKVDIKLCKLGNDAGMVGIIQYTIDSLKKQKADSK